eukprot:827445-Rhodomonas_salina.1
MMAIINPTSGHKKGVAVWEEVQPLFAIAGWDVVVHRTRSVVLAVDEDADDDDDAGYDDDGDNGPHTAFCFSQPLKSKK